jgi:hypothetical protein
MMFIILLLTSLIQVFVCTLRDIVDTYDGNVNFTFSGLENFRHDKYFIQSVSIFICLYTGFFILPIMMLFILQVKNFCRNRTTNERYTRKVYSHKESMTSSSSFSATTSILAEELINDLGTPRDFSDKQCSGLRNAYEMCCVNSAPT